MLNLLHISDFHYKAKHPQESKDRVAKIIEALSGREINFIIFSGDLVNKGENSFDKASDALIEPLLKALHLDHGRILIVPGNHDLDRDGELEMVKDSLSTRVTNKKVEEFCDNEDQFKLSRTRFKNFDEFIMDFYKDVKDVNVHELGISMRVSIDERDFGIIGLNSAWRAIESSTDRGHLIFPTQQARETFADVADTSFVLCAMHHNIYDFTDDVTEKLGDFVFDKCHFLFSGHNHRPATATYNSSSIGIIHSISPAIYNKHDNSSKYGFCLWHIDDDSLEATEDIYMFVNGTFSLTQKGQNFSIPVNNEKKKQNEYRKLLRLRLSEAKRRADKDFVSGEQANAGLTFESLFKKPVIKDKSIEELAAKQASGTKVPLSDIIDSKESICIFGSNKSGKTAILRKIQIDGLAFALSTKVLPYYLNYKEYAKDKYFDLKKDLSAYLNLNAKELDEFLCKNTILLLVDDLDIDDSEFVSTLGSQLSALQNKRLIICCESHLTKPTLNLKVNGAEIRLLYIHSVTEQEIHELTLSWPNISNVEKLKIEDKITKLCKQMNIPFNYWTVSLFLWIFEKTDPDNIHNNFELVQLYIDELLDRKGFARDKNIKLDFADLKSFLADLALDLYRKPGYRMSMDSLNSFIIDYRNQNKKFNIDAVDIINILLDKQVLERTNDFITFRLNGVFEFFLAYKMYEDKSFCNEVLENRSMFLAFGNELEFYAGLNRKDYATVERIFEIAKDILKPITSAPDYVDVDTRLYNAFNIEEINRLGTQKLLPLIDAIPEKEKAVAISTVVNDIPIDVNNGVQVKIPADLNAPVSTAQFERALFIIGRVFRNSNICNEQQVADQMLDYLLTGSCNLGFLHTESLIPDNYDDKDIKSLIRCVTNIMPIVVQAWLHDAISQKNLERVFKAKLDELYLHPDGNEYRIFILAMILTDMSNYDMQYWDKAKSVIKSKELRFSLYNKLLLMRFRYGEDPKFAKLVEPRLKSLIPEFSNEPKKDLQRLIANFKRSDHQSALKKLQRKKDYDKANLL